MSSKRIDPKKFTVVALMLMLAQFIYSGTKKMTEGGRGGAYKRFVELFKVSDQMAQILVVLGGAFELGASFMVIYAVVYKEMNVLKAGLYSLVIFTVMVTFLFKVTKKGVKWIPFLANLSLACTLFVIAQTLEKNEF